MMIQSTDSQTKLIENFVSHAASIGNKALNRMCAMQRLYVAHTIDRADI